MKKSISSITLPLAFALCAMVNICVSDEVAVSEPTLDDIDAPATDAEEREAEALLKKLSSANADITDENYYKFKHILNYFLN